MAWLRPVGLVAPVCAAALAAAWLGHQPDRPRLPASSSYPAEPDGAKALYLWAGAMGARAERDIVPAEGAPLVVLVAEPELPFSRAETRLYSSIVSGGGTVVIAGDTIPARSLARTFNVTIEATPLVASAALPDTGATVPTQARARVRADGATPLLLAPNGDWLALSKPWQQGRVVVLATAFPLSNQGLRDPGNARLVYRLVVAPAVASSLSVDEAHRAHTPAEVEQAPGFGQLLLETAAGRAVVYAVCLTFLYLLLANRRLGPPLPYAAPERASRTMFEHIETRAGLYRRGRQLPFLRDQYLQRYSRRLRRAFHVASPALADQAGAHEQTWSQLQLQLQTDLQGHGVAEERAARLAGALGGVARARSEGELLAAVTRLEGAFGDTPGLS